MHTEKPVDERVFTYLRERTHVDLTTIRRFAEKVEVAENGCWRWTASTRSGGYGEFSVGGKHVYGHRWCWVVVNGPVPDGLVLDHFRFPDEGCIGPLCVHPDHVRPTTNRENILRGTGACARNARKTACPQGHTYDSVDPNGWRRCSTCDRENSRERGKRQRERVLERSRLAGPRVAVLTDPTEE